MPDRDLARMVTLLANRAARARRLCAEADVVDAPLLDRERQIVDIVDAGIEEQIVAEILPPRDAVVGRRDEPIERTTAVGDADPEVREALELIPICQNPGRQEGLDDEA